MATKNDFKIIKQKSIKYFEYLDTKKNVTSDTTKARLGFYLFVIECITGNKDISDITNSIIDTEYCSIVFDDENNDMGMDAVSIDYDNNVINLFNFKYRENFSSTKSIKAGNAIDSSKFLMTIQNEDSSTLTPRTKIIVDEIISLLNSDDLWTMELYLVSNENNGLSDNDEIINQFKKVYDLNVNSITLDEITNFISDRPDDISAKILINKEAIMIFEEDPMSSSKSYLVKLSLDDLIRITCKSEDMRNFYNLEDLSKLKEMDLELGVLYDNVRGYLGDTKYNANIIKTIDDNPSKFFLYNNGITITAKNIQGKPSNGQKKVAVTINGLQIVNGGQTLRSIYAFKNELFDEEKLSSATVLVRLFETETDWELTNNIAEFTNSQNAISSSDLKSISNLQIQIERYLDNVGIQYVRKSGNLGDSSKPYSTRISMEKMAQIIYSKKGFPDRATNQKKSLFEKYYNDIFSSENLDIEILPEYINEYNAISEFYSHQTDIKGYDQKYLYVLFLNKKENNIEKNVLFVEKTLEEYKKEDGISHARKLIQRGFKELLEKNYK